jgi:large subunit ribosomal protein L6e
VAPAKTEAPSTVEKKIGGKANGSTRSVPTSALKASKYYPAEDVKAPRKSRKTASKAVLRSSIVPGTVLILLAGRFAGKRVVFLKQLDSGLLLVSGPFKLNGVPLRRVSQAYVIATSTKVDVADVKVPETVNDAYFAKAKSAKSSKEGEFFGEGKEKKAFPEEKKSEQKVRPRRDAALISVGGCSPSFGHQKGRPPEQVPQGHLGSFEGRPVPRAQVLGA